MTVHEIYQLSVLLIQHAPLHPSEATAFRDLLPTTLRFPSFSSCRITRLPPDPSSTYTESAVHYNEDGLSWFESERGEPWYAEVDVVLVVEVVEGAHISDLARRRCGGRDTVNLIVFAV